MNALEVMISSLPALLDFIVLTFQIEIDSYSESSNSISEDKEHQDGFYLLVEKCWKCVCLLLKLR